MPGLKCSKHLLDARMCLCSFQTLLYDLSEHAEHWNDMATKRMRNRNVFGPSQRVGQPYMRADGMNARLLCNVDIPLDTREHPHDTHHSRLLSRPSSTAPI
jgi:hypothetical protein